MSDMTKKLVLLVSDSIINGTKSNLDGKDLNKIFEVYANIKNNGVLHSLGQEGIIDSAPQASYLEISQSMFDYIGNQVIIKHGTVVLESKISLDKPNGVTILCCSYSEFIEYTAEFGKKIKERQEKIIDVLNELGEELIFVTNLQKSICDPISDIIHNDGV